MSENESLKKEMAKFQKFWIPSSILTWPENTIGWKRSKSCPASTEAEGTDEQNAVKVRVNFLSMYKLLTLTDQTLTFCLFYLDWNEALIKRSNSERVPIRLWNNIHRAIGNRIRKTNSRVKVVDSRLFQPFCHTAIKLAS